MKSQALSCSFIADAANEFGFNPKRDIETVIERVSCEGDHFLSITLPRLDDFLLEGLSSSLLPSCEGWKKKRGTKVPEFLQDLWLKIFDASGSLLPVPSVRAIYWIRQISRAFKKVFEVCDPDRVEEAIQSFFSTDMSLPRHVYAPETVSEVGHWLFGKLVGHAVCSWDSVFRNGPGAVADRLDVNQRWGFPTVSHAIQATFGTDRFRASWYDRQWNPPVVRDTPARLVAVPKTATKPRLISIEPSYNQYLQQSMMQPLYDGLTRHFATDIRNQVPNQDLARAGSVDGSLATIDLSEASDRISLELVLQLFSWSPQFTSFLEATRSYEVTTPDGRNFFLRKFASMGSALTFPVETMVFTTIVIMAMCIQDGDLSRKNALRHFFSRKVRVYGDDIVIPTPYFQSVTDHLQRYGLKVNRSKSFASGLFRESCGKDWYAGFDVTPKYVRRNIDGRHLTDETYVSLVSLHNQLFVPGVPSEACSLIREIVEYRFPGIPRFTPSYSRVGVGYSDLELGGLYFLSDSDDYVSRVNEDIHHTEFLTYSLRSKTPETEGSELAMLLKSLVGPKSEDPDHLFRGGRPLVARLRRGWQTLVR